MRKAGPKLSKACLNALIADGEVSKEEVTKRKEEIAAAKSPKKQKSTAEQKVVEALQKQERIVLDEPTFVALKKREPRFVEEAEAVEAPKFAEELEAQDPQKKELKAVADPADAKVPKIFRNAKAEGAGEHERNVIDKRKVVDKPKAQKAIGHLKSKTKAVTQKADQQGGTKEKSGHKAQTASQ